MKSPAEGVQIPIESATKAQLRAFANHLGCPTTNFDTEDKLRAKIKGAGFEEAHIVAFENAPTKAAEARRVSSGDAVAEPLVELTVHTQEGAGGKRSVFVGCNGKALLIPRNQRCKIKLRYLSVLSDAIETKYSFDDEAKAIVEQDLPSYPFQVHSMPSDAEIAAWRKFEAEEEARLAKKAA